MIDTLHLKFLLEDCVLPYLDNERELLGRFGPYRIGRIKNLIVKVTHEHVYVIGSLQKFITEDWEENLSYEENVEAINLISDTFSIDPRNVTVTRIDIAKNIEVEHTPTSYQSTLGHGSKYLRIVYKSTLYYQNTIRTLCAYDKGKELLTNGYKPKKNNLLRFEARYLKPKKTLGFDLKLIHLRDRKVYHDFISRWKKEYQDLSKVTDLINIKDVSPKDVQRYLAAVGIDQIGVDKVLGSIKQFSYYSCHH